MKSTEFTSIIIARGRSVTVSVVTGQQIVDGVSQLAYGLRTVGPGEILEVDADEAQRLIQTGYAVDPAPPPSAVLRQDGSDPREVRT